MDDAPVDIVDRDRPLVVEVAADTCDTCGHRAFLYAELRTGSLAYCAHHGTAYLDRLRGEHDVRLPALEVTETPQQTDLDPALLARLRQAAGH